MTPAVISSFLLMLGFVLLIWILYYYTNNPSIIDPCWSIGIFICSSSYIINLENWQNISLKTCIAWILLFLWAMRLSGYLWFTRIAKNHHDPRYETISKDWKISKSLGFLLNYLFQGALMMAVALPFIFIANSRYHTLFIIDYFAIILIPLAIIGEAVADWQLYQFKKHYPKMVCNVGLWNYSRHPNYFFELIIWFGFSLLGSSSQYGYLSMLSPSLLLCIFLFITGPITEKLSLKSRGAAFEYYRQTTSFIIPWFKKSQ